jgi:hypothetical protein
MKNYKLSVMALLLSMEITGCVQKSYKKTVVLLLHTEGIKDIKTAGVRGEGKPLSWRKDLVMAPVKKDSLYTATVIIITGYKYGEIKFTVNGGFELENKDDRKIYFNDKDTTVYEATFNIEK